MNCDLCPRKCNVDRSKMTGYCKMTNKITAARAALHMWEEPCISGKGGSGAVFFSGCQLRCVYCQNYNISNGAAGMEISIERLAEIFMELQDEGAENINLVTATHYVPQVVTAIKEAKKNGLKLPIVYNTSSFENVETIKMLEGYADIFLPDLKYYSSEYSMKYSNAKDYFKVASAAIKEMVRISGTPIFENNMMRRGTIVRHLMLPGLLEDSKRVVEYLHKTYGEKIYISLMNQYTPLKNVEKYPEINRKVTTYEYEKLVDYAISIGVKNGFVQEKSTQSSSFIPEFDYTGIKRL